MRLKLEKKCGTIKTDLGKDEFAIEVWRRSDKFRDEDFLADLQ